MKNKVAGRPRKSPRIFTRVLGGYIALTLLIVALTGTVSYGLVREYMVYSTKQELMKKAESVATMIARPGGKARVLTNTRMHEIQSLTDAQAIYVDTDLAAIFLTRGKHYAESYEDIKLQQEELKNVLDQEMVMNILEGVTASDVRRLEFMDMDAVFAGAPIRGHDGTVTGAMILWRPLVDVRAISFTIASMESIAGVFSLIVAILLAWLISRALVRPLLTLNHAARRVAEGYYGEAVTITQGDEIGQLGMTLNLLSSRLKDVIDNLRDEKSKLEQILAGIGEGIVAVDLAGNVVHYNEAALALLELPQWQMRGQVGALNHQQELMTMLNHAIQGEGKAQASWKNESGRVIAALVSPFFNEENAIIGAVGLLRDVSEADRLEQMRRDYIANISHELRTPLTGIRGMVEPLIDGLMETDEERVESYTVIYQETLRLERLIGEMLDLSRLQEGRVELELEPMEPLGLLQAAQRRVAARAAKDEIDLALDVPEESLCLMGDENRIIQVLTILLDNALSFTPRGGRVTLSARRVGDTILLAVEDTGAGIDPKDLPYIWERFFKADRSRMRTSGTGLGLSIAKLVVELMQGEIAVKTELGKGSTFTVTLTAARDTDII